MQHRDGNPGGRGGNGDRGGRAEVITADEVFKKMSVPACTLGPPHAR